MENYEVLNQLGDGAFGQVVKALHKKTGQIVAIKKMKQKYHSWEECVKLPEVTVMRRIHGHPNIVKMREVIREKNELFFVFEYMDGDLLGVICKAKQMQGHTTAGNAPPIPYPKIRSYIFQLLQSLAFLHQSGYFHRDIKPENLLVKKDPTTAAQDVVKLADFGLVKEIRARPPFTDYVSTRWYRAPELLLQDRAYSSPVDIWAAGCILAELITTRPLFAGSNEVDQLHKIMGVLGSPNEKIWPECFALAKKIRYSFPAVKGVGLERVLPPHLPPQALDLMKQMLSYDPRKRPTAQQCLQHPYFSIGLDEENFSPSNVSKQLANAVKKYVSSPQTAPSRNTLVPIALNAKRSNVGATTAISKQAGVGNPPPLSPLQALCSPTATGLSPVLLGEKGDHHLPVSKLTPAVGSEGHKKRKVLSPKLPSLSCEKLKGVVTDVLNGGDGGNNNGDVDLDALTKEFENELETLKVLPQQKKQVSLCTLGDSAANKVFHNPTFGKSLLVPGATHASPKVNEDVVVDFLNSTRYKRSSFSLMENGGPLHTKRKASLKKQDPLPSLPPALDSSHHAVSPSIKALLAKHMKKRNDSNS
ncbi:protein kinase, putative [Trypanosoma cruzi]|nr:protein kinase, putative [Trypanosoma cruzi]